MEIWLRPSNENAPAVAGVDRVLNAGTNETHLRVKDGILHEGTTVIGAHVYIKDDRGMDPR